MAVDAQEKRLRERLRQIRFKKMQWERQINVIEQKMAVARDHRPFIKELERIQEHMEKLIKQEEQILSQLGEKQEEAAHEAVPAKAAEGSGADVAESEASSVKGEGNKPKAKILVVDDEKAVVTSIKYHLEFEGYEVVTAYDGVEALEKVKSENPDLIVLDVVMPKLDGLETLKQLKGTPATKHIPVIMLTAYPSEAGALAAIMKDADSYVSKPFQTEEILLLIKRLLSEKQAKNS